MPGRLGPIVVTGVALSAAAAVVANPVVAPRADLRIPAVHLSADRHDDLAMLDDDFIRAVGPASTELSSNPIAVLRDLVTSLSADAAYLGRSVIVGLLFSGATAVVNTDLTSVTRPLLPPGIAPKESVPGPVVWPAPVETDPGVQDVFTTLASGPSVPDPVAGDLAAALAQVVSTAVDEARGLDDGTLLAAAVAAGALMGAQGMADLDRLGTLVAADLRSVLDRIVDAVPATAGIPKADPQPTAPQSDNAPARTVDASDSDSPAGDVLSVTPHMPAPQWIRARLPIREPVFVEPQAAASMAPTLSPAVDDGDADVPAPDGVRPRSLPRNAAADSARNQTRGMLRDIGDAARKAASDFSHAGNG